MHQNDTAGLLYHFNITHKPTSCKIVLIFCLLKSDRNGVRRTIKGYVPKYWNRFFTSQKEKTELCNLITVRLESKSEIGKGGRTRERY